MGVLAHTSDHLTPRDFLPLVHQHLAIVSVGGEQSIAVLDDDQIAIAAQPASGIDHAPGTRGTHVLAQSPRQQYAAAGQRAWLAKTLRRPHPFWRRGLGRSRPRRSARPRRAGQEWRAGRAGRRVSGSQYQNLPDRNAKIRAEIVPPRQIAIVQIVAPSNTVERVRGAHDVDRRTIDGGIGTSGQQHTAQSNGPDRTRQAQR